MASADSKRIKNLQQQLRRSRKKLEKYEAKIAQMEEEAKKKAAIQDTDSDRLSIARLSQDISSLNLSSDSHSLSDAKQAAALEILSRLLKD